MNLEVPVVAVVPNVQLPVVPRPNVAAPAPYAGAQVRARSRGGEIRPQVRIENVLLEEVVIQPVNVGADGEARRGGVYRQGGTGLRLPHQHVRECHRYPQPFCCHRDFPPIHAAGHRSVDGAEYIQQTLETAAADREPFSASQGHFGVAADEWQNFGDGGDTDNMLAGNSNECGRVEPLLQFGQRHIHPAALAATVERRHAFVNREIVGLFCRNYAEASALLGKEAGLRPRLGANEVVHRLVARGSDGLSHAVQSLGEPDAVHRFQQVVHGVHLKRIHGVFVERGAEYDFGTRQGQGGGDVEPAAPGHLNVEKDQVRLQRRNQFDRLFAFLRFANNLEVGVRG